MIARWMLIIYVFLLFNMLLFYYVMCVKEYLVYYRIPGDTSDSMYLRLSGSIFSTQDDFFKLEAALRDMVKHGIDERVLDKVTA